VEKLLHLAVTQINRVRTTGSERPDIDSGGGHQAKDLPRPPALMPKSWAAASLSDSKALTEKGPAVSDLASSIGPHRPGSPSREPEAAVSRLRLPPPSNANVESTPREATLSGAQYSPSVVAADVELGRRKSTLPPSQFKLSDQDSLNATETMGSSSRHHSRNLSAAWGPNT
jgi:hypothetical protein